MPQSLGATGKRRTLTAVAVTLLGAVSAVVTASPAQAVANGELVPDGMYRFATKLTMTNIPRPDGTTYNSACSAALIDPQWIITAGHCFHDPYLNRVSGAVPYATTATVGRADVTQPGGHVVNVVWVHQAAGTDIALGKLDTAIVDITPLALNMVAPTTGQVLRMTGYGATSSVNPAPSNQLRTGQFTITSVSQSWVGVVGRAPAPDTSACAWDSGAPYFSEAGSVPRLVSVESDGPSCPHSQEETTGRVDTIWKWIRHTMGWRHP